MENVDILIIGGGPAACSLSIMLRKYKYKVLILEKDKFPKHNLGESLLPIVASDYMKIIGLDKEIKKQGFPKKYGTTFIWGKNRTPWNLFFDKRLESDKLNYSKFESENILKGNYNHSYQVNRYIFDYLFVKKAKKKGVIFKENTKVEDLLYDDKKNIIGVKYDGGKKLYAKFIVDGSGQNSFIGSKLGLRTFNKELGFSTIYGYFKNFNFLDNFLSEHTQYIISVDIGWLWFIYIGKGVVSVGLVSDQKNLIDKDFFDIIYKTEEINKLITKDSILVNSLGEEIDYLYKARDWSYFNKKIYGENYLLIGDAAGFVDPVLSGGLSLALMSGIISAPYINKFLQSGNINILKKYQDKVFSNVDNYYQLAKYWYGNNKSSKSWFWEAKSILGLDISNKFNKRAFTYLASGQYYTNQNLCEANELRIENYAYNFEDINEIQHLFLKEKDFNYKRNLSYLSKINSDIDNKELKIIVQYLYKEILGLFVKISSIDLELYNILLFLYKNSKKLHLLYFILDIKNYKLIQNCIDNNNCDKFKLVLLSYSLFIEKEYDISIINNIKFHINDIDFNTILFNGIKVSFSINDNKIDNIKLNYNHYLN